MSTSVQDANSGNAGDLIKHSVNLQALATLLHHKPWSDGLHLYECHAGRGIYQPQSSKENNKENVQQLLSSPNLLLARHQWTVLEQLGIDHADVPSGKWYAGSACLNATMLSDGRHDTHFYEQDQEVSKDLECSVHRLKATASIHCCDGEAAIAQICASFDSRSVIILDPFSISGSARKRNYACILKTTACLASAPLLLFFYSWGKTHAGEALKYRRRVETDHPIWALRNLISANAIEILWYHERHYLMWVIVPSEIREQIQAELKVRVEEIRSTLFRDTGVDDEHRWIVRQLK
jgi:hypothetical protein